MATRYLDASTIFPAAVPNALGLFYHSTFGYPICVDPNGEVRSLYCAKTGQPLDLLTQSNDQPVRLNARLFTGTAVNSVAAAVSPSQTVTTTGYMIALQVAPMFLAGAGGSDLDAVCACPTLAGATGDLSGHLAAVRSDLDLGAANSTRTITGAVSWARIFTNFPSTMTYTGKKSIMVLQTPNDGQWDFLLDINAGHTGWINTTASLGAQIGQLLIRVGSTTRAIPYYATS